MMSSLGVLRLAALIIISHSTISCEPLSKKQRIESDILSLIIDMENTNSVGESRLCSMYIDFSRKMDTLLRMSNYMAKTNNIPENVSIPSAEEIECATKYLELTHSRQYRMCISKDILSKGGVNQYSEEFLIKRAFAIWTYKEKRILKSNKSANYR